jgi:UDP-glucuronate 4-epimerase
MRVLVTGAAGFIGSHLSERLLHSGHEIIGMDNFNDFYDPELKRNNCRAIEQTAACVGQRFALCEADIRDGAAVARVFSRETPDAVIHLAAAAGVRPSIERPLFYEEVNVRGTMHLLEATRLHNIRTFLFASSSSVYGENPRVPFSEEDPVDNPISPYAATKKAAELFCHSYHHLFGIGVTCLRFFTVYGPRQRPDLAIRKFTRLIDEGLPVPFYGDGSTSRDYTYIDDIIDGVESAFDRLCATPGSYDIFNIGGAHPVELQYLVSLLESALGKKANLEILPKQPGDVVRTWADLTKSERGLNYRPKISIEAGIEKFVTWYLKDCVVRKTC